MRRREFLKTALGATAGSLVLRGCQGHERERSAAAGMGPRSDAALPFAPDSVADIELALRGAPATVSLLAGAVTEVLRYQGRLLVGPTSALQPGTGGYLGPTLRVKRGQRIRIHLENAIGEDSIVHWHGMYVSERNDGHPSQVISSGQHYSYDFKVENRAGTYWYHPHHMSRTGPQVYRGLAGLLLVSDDEEARLALPDGDRELTLVLQDRSFDADNQLIYAPNRIIGFLGERLLVNGEFARTRELQRGSYRVRILNASNSRIYNLAWSDNSPLTVIGTDGGLLDAPIDRAQVVLAPGQRLDLWVNFGDRPGDDVWLESRSVGSLMPMMGMGRGMRMGRGGGMFGAGESQSFRIQRFVTVGTGTATKPPQTLALPSKQADQVPINVGHPRTFFTTMRRGRWLLNGRSFEMNAVAPNERVGLGALEEWEFINLGGHMAMAHPIHLHGRQFRIVERRSGWGHRAAREGILDQGWQDTFLLLPGDRVRLQVRFDLYPGMFLYHCHNLEHEDMGMMRNYLVESR